MIGPPPSSTLFPYTTFCGSISEPAIGAEIERAVSGADDQHGAHRVAIQIGVIGQHTRVGYGQRTVLIDAVAVIVGERGTADIGNPVTATCHTGTCDCIVDLV